MTRPALRDRLKIFRQKLSRTPFVHWLVGWLLSLYMRFTFATNRRIRELPDATHPYDIGQKNCIFAFWHGRLVLIPPNKPRGRAMHVLISRHNDGELIAGATEHFGIHTVRGSSSTGGMLAGREIIRLARKGDNVSITPDGPRGPNRVAQAGVVHIARMCGLPIIPISSSASRHKALKSWDRMQIPLPFGRIATCVGEPIYVTKEADDASVEAARQQVEDVLNQLTLRADTLIGLSDSRSASSAAPQRKEARQ